MRVTDFQSGNETVSEGFFLLPADSYKDSNMLDWVLSIKETHGEDSTQDLFNDLMAETFDKKVQTGGISTLALVAVNSGFNRAGTSSVVDIHIDRDHSSVDVNLEEMKKFYGDEKIEAMSPGEFYTNYKKFVDGRIC